MSPGINSEKVIFNQFKSHIKWFFNYFVFYKQGIIMFENIVSYKPLKAGSEQGSVYVAFRAGAENIQKAHLGETYFLTVGLGKRKESLEDEWRGFQNLLVNVFTVLRVKFLIDGIVASIEMYGKNNDRKNTKVLRPRAHMVIYTYNNFLGFPKAEVEMLFIELGFDYKMDFLKTPKHIAKASCYTVKSAKQTVLRNICQHFYGTGPTHVLINNHLENNPVFSASVV